MPEFGSLGEDYWSAKNDALRMGSWYLRSLNCSVRLENLERVMGRL